MDKYICQIFRVSKAEPIFKAVDVWIDMYLTDQIMNLKGYFEVESGNKIYPGKDFSLLTEGGKTARLDIGKISEKSNGNSWVEFGILGAFG